MLLPLAALALHVFFGALTGGFYGWLLLQAVPLRFRKVEAGPRPAPAVHAAADEPFAAATLVPEPSAEAAHRPRRKRSASPSR